MTDTVTHVVGARPNFMKAAPVVRALESRGVRQHVVHTGQHYDETLSDVFFRDLGLPEPDINLGVGSGSHAVQTANLLIALERAFSELRPGLVVVYGDINSTMAASLVAAKLELPVAHVEAGLRSFDNSMPEEINRRVTDLLSDLLFVTAPEGLDNLRAVGAPEAQIHFVGNPMIDTLMANLARFDPVAARARLQLGDASYGVATLHRPSNVDSPTAAHRVVGMLNSVASALPMVVPLHPRGRAMLEAAGLRSSNRLRVIEPLGYIDFMSLVRGSSVVLTDSGGIQEETTVLGVPCLTLRANTERPITISHGTNRLVTPEGVIELVVDLVEHGAPRVPSPPPLWDGQAGERIAAIVVSWIQSRASAKARPDENGRVAVGTPPEDEGLAAKEVAAPAREVT